MEAGRPTNVEHPGLALKREIDSRHWSHSDLIFILGCHPKTVSQLINGKQGVSPAMSKALGDALDMPHHYFADLQKVYDVALANNPDPGIGLRARMQQAYPIREMVRRGWLSDASSDDLASQLARFFDVADAAEVPHLEHAAKKTGTYDADVSPSQLAWLFRVKHIARSISVRAFSEQKLREAVERMRPLLIAPEEARHVPGLLADAGVRFVIVEALPGSKIDGACFWLDDRSPVVGMTTRFDRLDNFWFVLRHEIEHVLRGDGRRRPEGMIDSELQGEHAADDDRVPEEERAANDAAAAFCVSREKMESFILRKHPFFYEKDVIAFAKINGVHPALPVGQIQRRLGRYDYLRKHQIKVRQFVAPGAIVDGWGQSVPLN